jgi:hypothetical protein
MEMADLVQLVVVVINAQDQIFTNHGCHVLDFWEFVMIRRDKLVQHG